MILKLEEGGQPVAFLVQRITDDVSRRGNKAPQYKFSGRTDTDADATIWIFTDSAERQFARIGVTRESVVGKRVEFVKNDKGFIDITLPTGQGSFAPAMSAPAAPAAAAPARAAAAPAVPTPVDADADAKKEARKRALACVEASIKAVEAAGDALGMAVRHEMELEDQRSLLKPIATQRIMKQFNLAATPAEKIVEQDDEYMRHRRLQYDAVVDTQRQHGRFAAAKLRAELHVALVGKK